LRSHLQAVCSHFLTGASLSCRRKKILAAKMAEAGEHSGRRQHFIRTLPGSFFQAVIDVFN
jgi:hypothetical protein